MCCQSGGTGESRAEPPRACERALFQTHPNPNPNPNPSRHAPPGCRGCSARDHLGQQDVLSPEQGKVTGQDSDVQEGAGASLRHPLCRARYPPVSVPRCPGAGGGAGAGFGGAGRALCSFPAPRGTAAPALRGTNVVPTPCRALLCPGYSWQLQHNAAGMCQAGDGCQPRGHHWVHREPQRGHRRAGQWLLGTQRGVPGTQEGHKYAKC